jgi:hypothetical protein
VLPLARTEKARAPRREVWGAGGAALGQRPSAAQAPQVSERGVPGGAGLGQRPSAAQAPQAAQATERAPNNFKKSIAVSSVNLTSSSLENCNKDLA